MFWGEPEDYKTLLEAQSNLGEGLLIVEDERILYANEAFCRTSGYSEEELLSLPTCFDLLVEEERRYFDGRLRRRIDGELVVDHYEATVLEFLLALVMLLQTYLGLILVLCGVLLIIGGIQAFRQRRAKPERGN